MLLTSEQYERIARRLDGEAVSLSEAESAVAEELRNDERRVGGLLDAAPCEGAVQRAHHRVLASEIRRDEAAVGRLLDVDVPREILDRALGRAVAELARPQRRMLRIGTVAASVAAAAAILLAVGLAGIWNVPAVRLDPTLVAARAVPVDVLSALVQQPEDPAVDLLAGEIDEFEAELAAAPLPRVDLGIDDVERALFDFLLDDMPE